VVEREIDPQIVGALGAALFAREAFTRAGATGSVKAEV
jgi:activator of 2-hydroxyglutaryl-CoA dehydratase